MDQFSVAAAEEIFASYPEWKALSRTETYDDYAYLVIEIPAPASANTERGLMISTNAGEIAVSFDAYHSHFDRWNVGESDRDGEAALPFVQALLSEQIGIASFWRGDDFRGACQVTRGERPELTNPANGPNHLRVRSWHGNLNEDRDA